MSSMGSETDELKKFLNGLKGMEENLTKMSGKLHSELGSNFEKVLNSTMYDGEKKGKVNKMPAVMRLAKDGSVKIEFDKPEDGRTFFKSFKSEK